jgi:predicted CXXCH cytochrome family protein
LRRASSGGAQQGASEAGSILIHARKLTVGRAPNQHLQLSSPGVQEEHAVVTTSRLSGLRVAPLSGKAILVNGRREIRARRINAGDVIEIGTARLTVHPSRSRRAVILEVHEPVAEEVDPDERQAEGAAPGPRMSPWAWSLSLGFAALFLLLPLTAVVMPGLKEPLRGIPLLPSDALWSPGPLHTAHQSIGTRCDACHAKPFEPVRDQECFACHAVVAHHVDIRSSDVSLFRSQQCASCHAEHKQPAALVQRDPRLCTDCHADLKRRKPNTTVENVSDFGSDHPEFRVTVLASTSAGDEDRSPSWRPIRLDRNDPEHFLEHSHLHFSHAQHLNPKGVKSPTGERVLSCQDCHRPNASGRDMLPIRMETHCSGCHRLQFDEHDPTSGVPHGDLAALYKTLREHFSRTYLVQSGSFTTASGTRQRRPGNEQRILTELEQRRARAWVDAQSLKIAQELLEKRVCKDCHEVTRVPGRTGLEQWHVEPVRLTSSWMPRARFDHAAHISETCVSCHTGAPKSKHATDILLPDIARCRECHGGTGSSAKVASDCLMCHPFHIPTRGAWLRSEGRGVQAGSIQAAR